MSDQASLQERLEQERQERRRNLADFDKQFIDLCKSLRSHQDSLTIQALAVGILEGQIGKLIYKSGWRGFYEDHGGVAGGRIDQLDCLDAPQKKALRALLDALAAVAYGADTSRQKMENVTKLTAAVEDYGELRTLPTAAPADRGQAEEGNPETNAPQGLTVTQAARIAGCNAGEISRAAHSGSLKSNGQKGRQRRIDPADLSRWQLRRAERKEPVESNDAVERKIRLAGDK